MIELTESEHGLMQEEWDKFSLEHRNDFQSTFARLIAKKAFICAFKAGTYHERYQQEKT